MPGWQATVLFIAVGLVVLVPKEAPDVDLTALGFADEAIPATVESVANDPCSYAPELECYLVAFDLGDGGGLILQEFSEGPGQPVFDVGDAVFINVTSPGRFDRSGGSRPPDDISGCEDRHLASGSGPD